MADPIETQFENFRRAGSSVGVLNVDVRDIDSVEQSAACARAVSDLIAHGARILAIALLEREVIPKANFSRVIASPTSEPVWVVTHRVFYELPPETAP